MVTFSGPIKVAPGKNVAREMNVNICSALRHTRTTAHTLAHQTVIPWQNDQVNKLQNLLGLLKYTRSHTHPQTHERNLPILYKMFFCCKNWIAANVKLLKSCTIFVSNLAVMILFLAIDSKPIGLAFFCGTKKKC